MIPGEVSHYRIQEKLGEGGMGEVYLAEDTRLGRQVALKFLPASFQYDPDRRARFLGEARAASALRSPNIAAIYDIGEHQGAMFIAMEYVEGEVLSLRIASKSLPSAEVIDISIQIAEALDEAHELGIIHRDVKSSNLMVTERGLVKMLDFGLAKAQPGGGPGGASDPTVPLGAQTAFGIVLGTVSYMSPEQALGRDIDTRTDIFSFGVVMYEMLTSRLPFEGAGTTEIIDNIIHKEPVAIARFNYDVPAELERIVRKSMEKDRDRRYQSVRDLATDLRNLKRDYDTGLNISRATSPRTLATRRARPRKPIDSLAILPLINESGDPDTEYLSDGITESIINNLSQLPKLRVMARGTVFRYKGREIDPLRIGQELGVRALLTSRLVQRGETLIVKTELVDTEDGSHLWGDQYNRELSDIFKIEDEISKEISENLRLKLSGAQKKQLAKRHTENTAAYQLYLKGRFYWNKRTEEALKKGIEYFQQAIDLDSGYALAYAGLADSYNILASYSSLAPKDAFPISKAAATRALELDDKLAEGHASLAFVRFGYDWDWKQSERGFKQAIKLNPGYAWAHNWYAVTLAAFGRFEEAFAEINRACDLDPLSLAINTNRGWLLHLARRYDEAIEQYLKTIEFDGAFGLAHRRLAQTYEQKQMNDEAVAEFQKALALSGEDLELLSARGHFCAMRGDIDRALEVLTQLEAISNCRYVPAYLIARVYLGFGDNDRVFEYLDRACEERYGYLAYIKVDPIFDIIRPDARFESLTRRIGLAS